MRFYRQHPIVLISALIECVVLGGLGISLAMLLSHPAPLLLILVAGLLASLRWARWATFVMRIEGRQVTLRSLHGFVVTERVVPLITPAGLSLRQNMLGFLLDYGLMRIESFGTPVQIRYVAPFSSLKQQIQQG